jgi:DNA-directed RNA polymerase specialized sigma24 family protein
MPSPELSHFFAVLRTGDEQAVEQLLLQLDPILRRLIHLRLLDGRLRHLIDTADIVQSLLKNFLSQTEQGSSLVQKAGGLPAYLAAAVRYKILTKMRQERRREGALPDDCEPVSPEQPAVQEVEGEDLRQAIRARLSAKNCLLFDLRTQGLSWAQIAEQVGGNPDALRMRLRRTVAAVLGDLGHAELSRAQ